MCVCVCSVCGFFPVLLLNWPCSWKCTWQRWNKERKKRELFCKLQHWSKGDLSHAEVVYPMKTQCKIKNTRNRTKSHISFCALFFTVSENFKYFSAPRYSFWRKKVVFHSASFGFAAVEPLVSEQFPLMADFEKMWVMLHKQETFLWTSGIQQQVGNAQRAVVCSIAVLSLNRGDLLSTNLMTFQLWWQKCLSRRSKRLPGMIIS